ncbi:MAG: hypothetical protein GKR97_08030 [Rhizobiaceae bacterium]|nr:hypothetical protein [Rhizobiaceae bacterium]
MSLSFANHFMRPVFSVAIAQRLVGAVAVSVLLAACSGTVPKAGSTAGATYAAPTETLTVCSGYGCIIKDKLNFDDSVDQNLQKIMEDGGASAAAERQALRKAIAYMETASRNQLRFARDVEFSYQKNAKKRGQMDCVDESLNTISYLKYLHARGLLIHHRPLSLYAERGLLVDGRYPHKSARMRDRQGVDWAVDSWKTANGGEPEIFLLATWYKDNNDASNY